MFLTKRVMSAMCMVLLMWLALHWSAIVADGASNCLFFTETGSGQGGFAVCDDTEANFRTAFEGWGLDKIGYPVSRRYMRDGIVTQAFQKGIMQWRSETGSVALVNVFDELHHGGFDEVLLSTRQTPKQLPDGMIWLWRVSDGELLQELAGHEDSINHVTFSPNGQLLASASDDRTIRLWQLSDGTPLKVLTGHQGFVTGVVFTPDGTLLASSSLDETVRLWRVSDGEMLHTLVGHGGTVEDIAMSPNGQIIASASLDGTVRVWGVPK